MHLFKTSFKKLIKINNRMPSFKMPKPGVAWYSSSGSRGGHNKNEFR